MSIIPPTPTYQVTGQRPCNSCAGTGNKNFPKGGSSTSRAPYPCSTCKGSGKEVYLDTLPNPNYGKKKQVKDGIDKMIEEHNHEKEVRDILNSLKTLKTNNNTNAFDQNILNIYKGCVETYQHLKAPPLLIKECQNIIQELTNKLNVHAINTPMQTLTKTFTAPAKTYDHIPTTNKVRFEVEIKKISTFEEFCAGSLSDNVLDRTMGSMTAVQALSECEKIRYGRRIIDQYKKYYTECKRQGVTPEPIPKIDVLNRRLEYITMEDGEKVYNPNYSDPSCSIQ